MPMSSDDEKELLESYGWWYNSVKRQWESPVGAILSIDSLASASIEYGEAAERELHELAARYGKRRQKGV